MTEVKRFTIAELRYAGGAEHDESYVKASDFDNAAAGRLLYQRKAEAAEDRYQREVLGLNNEGDPIGGGSPGGLLNDLKAAEAARDRAYEQRNTLAVGLVKMALLLGWPAGRGVDGRTDQPLEWRQVVYVQLPNGEQVSWHIAPAEQDLLLDLPEFTGAWDGKFTGTESAWVDGLPVPTTSTRDFNVDVLLPAPTAPSWAKPIGVSFDGAEGQGRVWVTDADSDESIAIEGNENCRTLAGLLLEWVGAYAPQAPTVTVINSSGDESALAALILEEVERTKDCCGEKPLPTPFDDRRYFQVGDGGCPNGVQLRAQLASDSDVTAQPIPPVFIKCGICGEPGESYCFSHRPPTPPVAE